MNGNCSVLTESGTMVGFAGYCYASVLPSQNILGHFDLMFLCARVCASWWGGGGVLWTEFRSDMAMQTYFLGEIA